MSRVLVAMSGGVDSSVAAYLLGRRGAECVGVTMRLYEDDAPGPGRANTCCSLADVEDAQGVAARLGIPHYTLDLTAPFEETVIRRFVADYEAGLTPNPCVLCNRYLKFDLLWRYAREMGCDAVATGHYARVVAPPSPGGRFRLLAAKDRSKDQSYVLYPIAQEVLAHTLLPLGGLRKDEVRAIAASQGFANARKRDSQDICFVPDGDYPGFLARREGRPLRHGSIVDTRGRRLGEHDGMEAYTIGQRRGLGVSSGERLYVVAKEAATGTVVLGTAADLLSDSFSATEANWPSGEVPAGPVRVDVRIRYHGGRHAATVTPTGVDAFRVDADEPISAVAPGQSVVAYDGDEVVCGGTIGRTRGGISCTA